MKGIHSFIVTVYLFRWLSKLIFVVWFLLFGSVRFVDCFFVFIFPILVHFYEQAGTVRIYEHTAICTDSVLTVERQYLYCFGKNRMN